MTERPRHSRGRRGFTLLELVVVMAIVLLLSAMLGEMYMAQVRDTARTRLLSVAGEVAGVHDMTYASNGLGIGGPTVDSVLDTFLGAPATDPATGIVTWSSGLADYAVTRDPAWPRAAYEFRLTTGTGAACYVPPDNPQVPGIRTVLATGCAANPARLVPTSTGLPAPTGLTAAMTAGTALLSWDAAAPGTGTVLYRVYRCTSTVAACAPGEQVASTVQTDLADPNRETGQQYTYAVTASTATATSAQSEPATVTAVPLAPTVRLARWDQGSARTLLRWGPPLGGEGDVVGYRVLRCAGQDCAPGDDDLLATVAAVLGQGSYGYDDDAAAPGTRYRYAVVSVNAAGTSAAANASYAVLTPPAPPATVTAQLDPATGAVVIAWDPAPTATGYVVRRCAAGTCLQLADTSAATTGDLPPAGTYAYAVAAVNASGASADASSPEVTVP
jgi:prepilin-type N-terminal cleavage/methylation domain-containing protein